MCHLILWRKVREDSKPGWDNRGPLTKYNNQVLTDILTHVCKGMIFIAIVFIVVKEWEKPEYPSIRTDKIS